MTLSANQHKAIAIVLFLSLTVFLRLGSGEIQPNEEGLNAMSAKSITQQSINSGQAKHSATGIYSSSKPPLIVWAIAGSMSVFGENTFSVRLFTALCSAMALAFFYLISRRFLTYSSSIIALFLLSGTVAWNNYARQGLADIPVIAFILGTLFFILKTLESTEKKYILTYSLFFALSFLCVIITKPIVWLFPLVFVGCLFLIKEKKKQISFLIFAGVLAIILSFLLYLIVTIKSGNNILSSLFPFQSVFDIINYSRLRMLDYFNQIIISNPFIIFGFIYIIFAFNKINKLSANSEHGKYLNYMLGVWFLIVFIILSDYLTNHPNYIVYLLPPAILLSLKFFDSNHLITKSNRILWIIVTALIAFFLWSFIFNLRQEVELLITGGQYSFYALLFIIIIIISILCAFILPKKLLDKISPSGLYYSITLIPYLMIFKVILLNLAAPTGDSFGAIRTADILNSADSKSFIYLYHESTPSDSINTQLDWYTDGWLSGWDNSKTYIPIKQIKDYVDYENLRRIDEFPDLLIVYYIHRNISIKSAVMKDLLSTRSIISRKNNYFRQKKIRKKSR